MTTPTPAATTTGTTTTTTAAAFFIPPKTMKACLAKDYGDIDTMLTVVDGDDENNMVPYPSLANLHTKYERANTMIIKTYAVATACGDCRTLSGLTKKLQGPPSFPYIPCGDCSGIVVEIPKMDNKKSSSKPFPFQVGDKVTARFVAFPRNALAEYALVRQEVCEKIPNGISFVDAAALAGACPATLLAERILSYYENEKEDSSSLPVPINDNDKDVVPKEEALSQSKQPQELKTQGTLKKPRILILGARGGVGSLTSQILKRSGRVSFLAGTASPWSSNNANDKDDHDHCYDTIIDYTKQDPFTMKEYQDNPFDIIVDLAGAGAWLTLNEKATTTPTKDLRSIVKPASEGGRYVTLTPDTAIFALPSISAALKLFLLVPLWRALKSRTWAKKILPKYTYAMCLDEDRTHLTRTLTMATPNTTEQPQLPSIHAVVDSRGPHPFTTEGVRTAFKIQESRHIRGKVVIQLMTEDEKVKGGK